VQDDELVLQYLKQVHPKTFDEVTQLRIHHPDQARLKLEIIQEEHKNVNFNEYDLARDNNYIKSICEQYQDIEGIVYLNQFFNATSLRHIGQMLWQYNHKIYLPISKETCLQGKITNKIFSYPKRIPVATIVMSKETEFTNYLFMNEKANKKLFRTIQILHADLWVYHFNTGKQEYVLLSQKELDTEDYIIEGTFIEVEDNPLFGSTARLTTKMPMILVNNCIKRVQSFENHKQLFEVMKKNGITKDCWFNYLFYHPQLKKTFRHPELFEKLISAFLLAAKQDYYLHLLIISDPGSGKSTLEECLWHKLNEKQDIVGCGQSTLKSLVPSFKTQPPSPGSLINSSRIAIVDEFLRILVNIEKTDREFQLGRLNDLLENRARAFESGQGRVQGKMTSKFLGVTNPIWNTSSMEKLIDQIDMSFVSRVLVWYQSKEHLRWVYDEKGISKSVTVLIDPFLFLAIYDYCQSFVSFYDDVRLKVVVKECRRLLEDQPTFYRALMMYDARYVHHARCLLDGIVKTRCLCSDCSDFVAVDEDYLLLKELFVLMLISWGVYVK